MSAVIEAELISSPMLVPRFEDLPPLTVRESNFVREYLNPDNYRNATKAAELAGYTGDYMTIAQTGYQNLNKPKIQAHIQHALKARHISPDEVIAQFSDIALLPTNALQSPANPNSPYNAGHKLNALKEASELLGMKQKANESVDSDQAKAMVESLIVGICEQLRQGRQALNPASITNNPQE